MWFTIFHFGEPFVKNICQESVIDETTYICSICGRPLHLRLFRSINLFPHILSAILPAEQFSYIAKKAERILDSTECKLTNNITLYSYDLTQNRYRL